MLCVITIIIFIIDVSDSFDQHNKGYRISFRLCCCVLLSSSSSSLVCISNPSGGEGEAEEERDNKKRRMTQTQTQTQTRTKDSRTDGPMVVSDRRK